MLKLAYITTFPKAVVYLALTKYADLCKMISRESKKRT